MAIFYPQKILTTNKTEVTFAYNNYSSMVLANSGSAGVTIDLYVLGSSSKDSSLITITDITNTGVLAAEAEVVSTSSVTLNVDTVLPTDELLKDERVYKSDGTFFGIATATADASPDTVTFSGGLENAIADDDPLYTGTRYYFLRNVKIPKGSSLKLTSDEFKFDDTNYKLYINSSSATGDIDIITRY